MYWLFRLKNKLSMEHLRLLYIVTLRPVWSYAIPIWGSTADWNYKLIQVFRNKVLQAIAAASKYVSIEQLHHDLNIDTVK